MATKTSLKALNLRAMPTVPDAVSKTVFPHVTTLAFGSASGDQGRDGPWKEFLSAFPALENLTMLESFDRYKHELLAPILQGPALQTLRSVYLYKSIGPNANAQVMTLLRECTSLRILGLKDVRGVTERVILSTPVEYLARLETLYIGDVFEWDIGNVLQFFLKHSAQLKTLSLMVGEARIDPRVRALEAELREQFKSMMHLDGVFAWDHDWWKVDWAARGGMIL